MRKTYLMCALLAAALSSCQPKKEPKRLIDNFDDVAGATTQRMVLEYDSLKVPQEMECMNGQLYFLNNFYKYHRLISRFDIATGKFVGEYLQVGQGPGEFLNPGNLSVLDGKLTFNDYARDCFVWCDADLNPREVKLERGERITMRSSIDALSPTRYICCVKTDEGRYAIIDEQGEIITIFDNDQNTAEQGDASIMLGSQAAYNQEQKILAVADTYGEWVRFYNLADLQNPTLLTSYTYVKAVPKIIQKDGHTYFDIDDGGSATYSIKGTRKFCICLMEYGKDNGKQGTPVLLFFNWKGKPVKALQLPQDYSAMTADDERIYLLGTDRDTGEYIVDTVNY